MRPLPVVSVITTSFNRGAFLPACVESVRSLHYPNVEHLIIDGGSNDGTREFLVSLPAEVKWVSEKDRGQSHAFNKGLAMATGKYIGWLNADDLYYPEAFGEAVELLEESASIVMVYGAGDIVDATGVILRDFVPPVTVEASVLVDDNTIFQPSTVMRRSVLAAIGGVDESLVYTQDYDLWLRLLGVGPFRSIDVVMSSWREHDASLTVTDRAGQLAEFFDLRERFGKGLR